MAETMMALFAPPKTDRTCSACSRAETSLPGGRDGADPASLKSCGRCKNALYCHADCQKAHWKAHKQQNCPFGALMNNIYLHTLPTPEKVYIALIDSHRLRRDDEYIFHGDVRGAYAGQDPLPRFREFLSSAKKAGQLPDWWSAGKKKECERLGMRGGGSGAEWSDLNCAVEKQDIIDHYGGDSFMPMKLRILAEKITGKAI